MSLFPKKVECSFKEDYSADSYNNIHSVLDIQAEYLRYVCVCVCVCVCVFSHTLTVDSVVFLLDRLLRVVSVLSRLTNQLAYEGNSALFCSFTPNMFALLVNLDVPLSTGQPLDYSHMSTAVSQHCLWPDTSISSPTFTGLKHKE